MFAAGLAAICTFNACGGSSTSKNNNDDDDDGTASSGQTTGGGSNTGGGGAGGMMVEPGAPVISEFSTPAMQFEPNEGSITFNVNVVDPDGSADIQGGTLTDTQGLEFGTFLKSGGGDGYALQLSWNNFEEMTAIQFANGGVVFTFVATFTDLANHQVSASLDLQLGCGEDLFGYCGYCTNTDDDSNHCGGCNNECLCDGSGSCATCTPLPAPPAMDCNGICAAQGKTCSDNVCDNDGGRLYDGNSCGGNVTSYLYCSYPFFDPDGASVECCCI